MLRLTSLGRERAAVGASSAGGTAAALRGGASGGTAAALRGGASFARTRCERFAFGGVAFELLCAQGGGASALSTDERRFCVVDPGAKVIADVVCAVHEDPAFVSGEPNNNGVRVRATQGADGSIAMRSRAFTAELSPLGSRRYAAAARLGPGPDGYAGLLRGVAAAVLQRHGGLILRAAALELDGRAVLFVGPSGAGKSTAVRLSDAGRCFAHDHVALVPSEAGWFAWGLPGGTPADAPLATGSVYPLAAVLRVHQADSGELSVTRLAAAQALFALRESVEWADETLVGEEVYLRAAIQLSSAIPIGAIATVLRRSTSPALRAWLTAAASSERVS